MITFIASHLKQNSRQEEKQGETRNQKKKNQRHTHKETCPNIPKSSKTSTLFLPRRTDETDESIERRRKGLGSDQTQEISKTNSTSRITKFTTRTPENNKSLHLKTQTQRERYTERDRENKNKRERERENKNKREMESTERVNTRLTCT
jgi:hypothetical protein